MNLEHWKKLDHRLFLVLGILLAAHLLSEITLLDTLALILWVLILGVDQLEEQEPEVNIKRVVESMDNLCIEESTIPIKMVELPNGRKAQAQLTVTTNTYYWI